MRAPAVVVAVAISVAWVVANGNGSSENPLTPSGDSNTIPAFPVVQQHKKTCRLDLSDELFGGVKEACGDAETLERSRCCPVLAAWLYAAHARTALEPAPAPAPAPASSPDLPVLPDDSQACVNTLQTSLQSRGINIPRPNATCDAIQCFCGIRLHQLSSLNCPTPFNLSAPHRRATKPAAAVRALESNCTNPSYQGCTRCLKTLEKLKAKQGKKEGSSERTSRMHSRDCELMGLTWLLAKNKTAYIPTVSAVLRALMYSTHRPGQSECSPDQENMPLAVDSLQLYQSSGAASHGDLVTPIFLYCTLLSLLLQFWKGF